MNVQYILVRSSSIIQVEGLDEYDVIEWKGIIPNKNISCQLVLKQTRSKLFKLTLQPFKNKVYIDIHVAIKTKIFK